MRTYGRLDLVGGQWVLSRLEPHVAIRLKDNFRQLPRHRGGPFKLPATGLIAADLSWFLSRYPLDADAAVLEALEGARVGYEQIQAEAGRVLAPDYQPPLLAGLREGVTLDPHQRSAVELLGLMGGLLVADAVGEGKTYTIAAACLLPAALPATVVVLPNLRGQVRDKIAQITNLSVQVLDGGRGSRLPPADVRVMGYSQLAGWVDSLSLFGSGLVAFDEVAELRHGLTTDKGQAAFKLVEGARLRLGTSATPLYNKGAEIWQVMQYLRPEVLGDRADFLREWCGGTDVVTDPDALGAYLRDQKALVRKESRAPPVNTLTVSIDHDARAIASVQEAAAHLARQAMLGPASGRGEAAMRFDMLLRQATGIAKARFAAAYVRMLVEAGRPVALFGYHREVYRIWADLLGDLGVVFYTGTETQKQKDQAVADFVSGRAKVFAISIRAGVGLDGIQAVSRDAVIAELDWSPATHEQNGGRLNRRGQPCWPERVNVHYLISDGGTDPFMVDVLGLKASQAAGIVDPGLGRQRAATDTRPLEALIQLYAGEGRAVA